MRRLCPLTRSAVSARSSGVDGGIPPSATTGLHTSTAMMSAPSSARRTACDRPCPRAAPVMNATLPSTLPISDLSFVTWNDAQFEDPFRTRVGAQPRRGFEVGGDRDACWQGGVAALVELEQLRRQCVAPGVTAAALGCRDQQQDR